MSEVRDTPDITVFAKSPWAPSIRREHAWAREAALRGLRVRYLERPLHVRNPGALGALARGAVTERPEAGIETVRTATVVPGHRADWAQSVEAAVLRRAAGRAITTSVVNLPWHWDAGRRAARRVYDVADDWAIGHPHRAAHIGELNRRIADEADAILVTEAALGDAFPGRTPLVVANGTSRDLLDRPVAPAPGARRMTYLGTVTRRVDHDLLAGVLAALPEWSLDLIGPMQFPGRGTGPDTELAAFLNRFGGRVRCHGAVARPGVGPLLDAADVLVIPHRVELCRGQDSMKLYDYAAHGRPIVSTLPATGADPCPHVRVTDTVRAFTDAVTAEEDASCVDDRRAWAARNTWGARSPLWLAAVLGSTVDETVRDVPGGRR